MKLKKRKKSRRMRGTRLYGKAMKKHKGKGSKGGKGMAGTGKRADQKKTYILKYEKNYFGKRGLRKKKRKIEVMNLEDIEKNLEKLGKKGKEGIEINLPGYKILGRGKLNKKIIINAKSFSSKAREKIEKIGGKANAV
jgi:large subunit ribosomal protein L15